MVRRIIIVDQDPLFRKVLASFSSEFRKTLGSPIYSQFISREYFPKEIKEFFVEVEKLYGNKKIDLRRKLMDCFSISRLFFKSTSFRKRVQVILLGKVRVKDLKTFSLFLRFTCRREHLLFYIVFLMGILQFPRVIFQKIIFFGLKDHKNFIKKLRKLEKSVLVFATNGLDNFYFILNSSDKPKNLKYFAVVYSWDNISSKLLPSTKLDHLALWNYRQKQELLEIHKSEVINTSVVGSQMADRAYKFYSSKKYLEPSKSNKKSLILLGMFNRSDELADLIELCKLMRGNSQYWYETFTYRPHPISKSNLKKIDSRKLDQLGINVNYDRTVDLRQYGGVICFPTSIIFEVLVAESRAVIFAPEYLKYRVDPKAVTNYKHFNWFKELNPIPIVDEFQQLLHMLKQPLPLQNKIARQDLDLIFPKFNSTYNNRLKKQIINYI